MDSTRQTKVLMALCLLGLVLRLGVIVVLRAWEDPNAMEHGPIAEALLRGDGFAFNDWRYYGPSSVQSPTYPLLLAALFWVFGVGSAAAYGVALGLNAVLGAATVWLTHRMARAMGAAPAVAMVSAALVAVWPTQLYAASHAQAIAIITAATAAAIWLWYRSIDTGRLGPWVAFGVIGCVGALTEPVLLPPMALAGLLIFVWRADLTARMRLRNAAVLLFIAVVILGPWTARNFVAHGQFVAIKSGFWVNVWKGNNPYATGTDRLAITEDQIDALSDVPLWERDEIARARSFDDRRQYDMLTREQRAELYGKSEMEREKAFGRWTRDWIAANPGRYVQLCGIRLVKTLWIEWDNPKSRNLVYMGSRTVVLALSLVGGVLALRRRWRLGFPAVVIGLALVTYTLTVTAARFILPLEPIFLCLTALATVAVWRWAMVAEAQDEESPQTAAAGEVDA